MLSSKEEMDIGGRIEVKDETFTLRVTNKIYLGIDYISGEERIEYVYDYWKIYWGYKSFQWRYGIKKYYLRLDLHSKNLNLPKTIWYWSMSRKVVDGWRGIFSPRYLIKPELYLEIRYVEGLICLLLRLTCRTMNVNLILMWKFSFIYPYTVTMITYENEEA